MFQLDSPELFSSRKQSFSLQTWFSFLFYKVWRESIVHWRNNVIMKFYFQGPRWNLNLDAKGWVLLESFISLRFSLMKNLSRHFQSSPLSHLLKPSPSPWRPARIWRSICQMTLKFPSQLTHFHMYVHLPYCPRGLGGFGALKT